MARNYRSSEATPYRQYNHCIGYSQGTAASLPQHSFRCDSSRCGYYCKCSFRPPTGKSWKKRLQPSGLSLSEPNANHPSRNTSCAKTRCAISHGNLGCRTLRYSYSNPTMAGVYNGRVRIYRCAMQHVAPTRSQVGAGQAQRFAAWLGRVLYLWESVLMPTLYQLADSEIRSCIVDYLALAEDTSGFSSVSVDILDTSRKVVILLAGINAPLGSLDPELAVREWERRRAVPLDTEAGVTAGVYMNIRDAGALFLKEVKAASDGFRRWHPEFIHGNPHVLPILQHLAGVFSKAALKRQVGSVSDNSISRPAARRLADLLASRVNPNEIREGEILQRLEATLEGIVRDLVGRVMLESMVESALSKAGVPYKRENQYSHLSGVVYDHRADFIVPDDVSPRAFIEVRKSSSRHASLYAKDKMFSAVNWKGQHRDILAVLVVDGEWTAETLRIMARVFDYVTPLQHVGDLAAAIADYLAGDSTRIKWLIDFSITPANR